MGGGIKKKKSDPARIRTWNPLIRSQMPYPLGHRALRMVVAYIKLFVRILQLQGILEKNSLRLTAVILFDIEDKKLVKRITGRLVRLLLATLTLVIHYYCEHLKAYPPWKW